jgi:hypothetical protein
MGRSSCLKKSFRGAVAVQGDDQAHQQKIAVIMPAGCKKFKITYKKMPMVASNNLLSYSSYPSLYTAALSSKSVLQKHDV